MIHSPHANATIKSLCGVVVVEQTNNLDHTFTINNSVNYNAVVTEVIKVFYHLANL